MRMITTHKTYARKKPVNLSVDAELLEEAKALDIALSAEFESLLERLVAEKKHAQWKSEVQESVTKYEAYIDKNGLFSDEIREF